MDPHTDREESFLKLYDECADSIFRHCYFRVNSRELAEDLTQESFMRMWNQLREQKSIDNPKALLYRIAGNLIIDFYRKKKGTSLHVLSEGGFDPVGEDESSILAYAAVQEALGLLKKLESPYREVLSMRYVDGLPPRDIADILGESENAVSVRIHPGMQKLKQLFQHGTPP